MLPTKDLFSNLTDAQRRAVTHIDGPLLVLAGPGSGKTRVITCRIAHLIQQSVRPYNILAVTFTNKAAQEMRERLQRMNLPHGGTICTFHSLCARLLREFHQAVGIHRDFTIYDTADQKTLIREAIKVCNLDTKNFTPGKMLNVISQYKNDLVMPGDLNADDGDFLEKRMAKIYAAYQNLLTKNAALDFDDLLVKLAFLLRDNDDIRQQLNQRYRYVLVDEYQDTNHCQYLIARGLALEHSNLCVTGDPDQSIYGWRGADITNILTFEKDHPQAQVVRLEENFRSTPQVLLLADQLISKNVQRKHKELFTSNPDGDRPNFLEYDNEHNEAQGLIDWIQSLRKQGLEYRDIAVFYRINSMSRVLEESFIKHHVPYQIVRGVEFYQRREIKDMLAYLRLLNNPADRVSLERIINRPIRGIGDMTVKKLIRHADLSGIDIGQTLANVDEVADLSAAAKTRVKKFVLMIDTFRSRLDQPVADILKMVYEQSGLENALAAEKDEEPADNVEELINAAADYDQTSENPSLAEYLQQIALVSDQDKYDEQAGAVSLMTLHAAKGLEFPAVRIIGVENGLIPHTRSIYDGRDVEEERRLLFVGITRAEKMLTLSFARRRMVMGSPMMTMPSEFLFGLDAIDHSQADGGFQDESDFDDNNWRESEETNTPKDDSQIFSPGQLVRHPTLGMGRIEKMMPSRDDSKVIVRFTTGQRKTLVLKYAKLEKIEFADY